MAFAGEGICRRHPPVASICALITLQIPDFLVPVLVAVPSIQNPDFRLTNARAKMKGLWSPNLPKPLVFTKELWAIFSTIGPSTAATIGTPYPLPVRLRARSLPAA